MRSKLDPSLILSFDTYVLSIVKHGEHAMFLLEEILGDAYSIRKIHFTPKDHSHYCFLYGASLEQLIGNQTLPGEVTDASLVMGKSHDECTRNEIFTKLKLNQDEGKSWSVSRNKLFAMMNIIGHEKYNHKNAPAFNIKGKINTEGPGHNCCTWVVEKAKLAGIDVSPYLVVGIVAYSLDLSIKKSSRCVIS